MMTRKHFRAIAQAVADTREQYPDAEDALNAVANRLERLCAQENPNFHAYTFREAAGTTN